MLLKLEREMALAGLSAVITATTTHSCDCEAEVEDDSVCPVKESRAEDELEDESARLNVLRAEK